MSEQNQDTAGQPLAAPLCSSLSRSVWRTKDGRIYAIFLTDDTKITVGRDERTTGPAWLEVGRADAVSISCGSDAEQEQIDTFIDLHNRHSDLQTRYDEALYFIEHIREMLGAEKVEHKSAQAARIMDAILDHKHAIELGWNREIHSFIVSSELPIGEQIEGVFAKLEEAQEYARELDELYPDTSRVVREWKLGQKSGKKVSY